MNYRLLILVLWVCRCDCILPDYAIYNGSDYGNEVFDLQYSDQDTLGEFPLLNRKIVYGSRVSVFEHPYVVSIRRLTSHYLTAVIISKYFILTVAHAVVDVPIQELTVVIGENYNDRGARMDTIILVIIPTDFDEYTYTADIALLRTYEKISHRPSIKPIYRVLNEKFILENHTYTGFVTGWGRCDTTGRELCLPRSSIHYPNEIQDPMMKTVTFDVNIGSKYCAAYRKHGLSLGPGMLCLGRARQEDLATPCMAVPGAPLVVDGRLLGLSSWGFGCGYKGDLPLVYTDIRHYYKWILETIMATIPVDNSNFTSLYLTTRACKLNEFLNKTRVMIHKHILSEPELYPWAMDRHLALIKGEVYDIRDFMYEGKFQTEKERMYEVIRAGLVQKTTTTMATTQLGNAWKKRRTTTPHQHFDAIVTNI